MNNKEIVTFFDKLSVDRDAKLEENPILYYEQKMRQIAILELLKPQKGDRILDVGCGNLRDGRLLAKGGCKVWGIDISTGMLMEGKKIAQKEGLDNITILRASATHLPFPNDYFNKIVCSEVIEHIPEYQLCITEMVRCLKRGGTVVITTPNRMSLYGLNRSFVELAKRVLRRKPWAHPYDEWKTEREIIDILNQQGLKEKNKIGICFLPGFSLTALLPLIFSKMVVKLIEPAEMKMRLRMHRYGYMTGISATK